MAHAQHGSFRPMAEVAFRPVRQLSEYKGKGASASREGVDESIGLSEMQFKFQLGTCYLQHLPSHFLSILLYSFCSIYWVLTSVNS